MLRDLDPMPVEKFKIVVELPTLHCRSNLLLLAVMSKLFWRAMAVMGGRVAATVIT
jgi:hypothetical protein